MADNMNLVSQDPLNDISVVIPYYNSSETLLAAVNSVIAQTRQVREVILVDDASSSVHALAAERLAKTIPLVRYVRLPYNSGPSAARNRGVSEAKGQFVAFLDADDQWLTMKMEIIINFMQINSIDFLGHNTISGGRRNKSINDILRPLRVAFHMDSIDIYLSTSQFAPSTVVFRRSKIPVRFDERIRRSEDYRLWGDLVFRGYKLWKLKTCLSTREDKHINGRGLSGDVEAMLQAHLDTVVYFAEQRYVSRICAFFMYQFLRLKYIRHR